MSIQRFNPYEDTQKTRIAVILDKVFQPIRNSNIGQEFEKLLQKIK